MWNTKFIRAIGFVLLFSCISALFVGCVGNGTGTVTKTEDENLTDKEKFIEQIKRDFSSCANGDTIEFTAELFAQHGGISAVFPIDIRIVENSIYIDDVLYNSINIVKSPTFSYDDLTCRGESVTKDEVASIVQKIKKSKTCHILETDSNGRPVGQTIVVYVIDEEYYFVHCFENNDIAKIWRANK